MTTVLLNNIEDGRGTALDRATYESRGGYTALRKVLADLRR